MITLCFAALVLVVSQRQTAFAREVPPPERGAELRAGVELRVHEAAHLTGHDRLATLEAELARPSGSATQALEALEALGARRQEVESISQGLLEAVRDRIAPPLEGAERIELVSGGRLALLGLPAQHDWLAAFLSAAATFKGLIDIQARVYEVPRGTLPEDFTGRQRTLEPGEASRLMTILAQRRIEVTTAPRTLTFPFRKAELAVVEQIPYVRDYEIKVLPELEGEIADPVIAVAEHGTHFSLRGVPQGDDGLIVYAELEYVRVARPIPSVTMELLPGHPVTLQLPAITRTHIEGCFELGPQQSLMLLGPADLEGETDVLLLLQARRVPEQPGAGR